MLLIFVATFLLGSVKGLDECGLVTVTASSPANHYGTLTPYYGNEIIWGEYVTTGAGCSTDGGTLANLETVPCLNTTLDTDTSVWVHGMPREPDTAL